MPQSWWREWLLKCGSLKNYKWYVPYRPSIIPVDSTVKNQEIMTQTLNSKRDLLETEAR